MTMLVVACMQEIQETVLRLIRTADQLLHGDRADAEAVRKRLQQVDTKCEDFTVRLDARRKNLVMARNFFAHAQAVSSILSVFTLGGLVVRALDSGPRGREFDSRRVRY